MDKERVKKLVRELIIEIGEDPTREGLKDTPRRIADAYTEIFSGYDSDSELSVQFSEDSEMVVAKIFNLFDVRTSHVTIFGTIQIAYIPNGRVFGISKLVRVVEKFSKRLQIQERITKNVADEIYAQGVKGVAVMAEGEHLCMKMRGVRNDAQMTSSAFRGVFEDQKTKEELTQSHSKQVRSYQKLNNPLIRKSLCLHEITYMFQVNHGHFSAGLLLNLQ